MRCISCRRCTAASQAGMLDQLIPFMHCLADWDSVYVIPEIGCEMPSTVYPNSLSMSLFLIAMKLYIVIFVNLWSQKAPSKRQYPYLFKNVSYHPNFST